MRSVFLMAQVVAPRAPPLHASRAGHRTGARPRRVCPFSYRACARVPQSPCSEEDGRGQMTGIRKLLLLAGALCACTSVKMVQRDGCWVKQTSRTLGGTTEELGFCGKARPEWAEDRLARLVQACMAQAASALGLEAQNDALKSRLVDVSQDRQALRTAAEKDREFLEQNSDKMITALGEAAKKPPPSAVATATSTGTAKTESDLRTAQEPA